MLTREPVYLIENGYLDLHLWVTYKCNVGCPHCYLKAMKSTSPDLTLEKAKFLLDSIRAYRKDWKLLRVTIYGAEPQSLSTTYYHALLDLIDSYFPNVEYSFYTSLQHLDSNWLDLFSRIKRKCGLQMTAVSYDGLMRGELYNTRLFNNLAILSREGLKVGMMSVVNKTLLELGASHYVKVLRDNNLGSFSLKPFLPISGQLDKWKTWAATTAEFAKFAIAIHEELKSQNLLHLSGMIRDICHANPTYQNIGGWVVFVDGNLNTLYMGYRDKQEYLQTFGTISTSSSFESIIEGEERLAFLNDQRLLHRRGDCLACDYAGSCLAEVFKDDYDESGECVGIKTFVEWVHTNCNTLYMTKV
jgi:sulfatase maturation enzyme AslB (radical SAM superfamily)